MAGLPKTEWPPQSWVIAKWHNTPVLVRAPVHAQIHILLAHYWDQFFFVCTEMWGKK